MSLVASSVKRKISNYQNKYRVTTKIVSNSLKSTFELWRNAARRLWSHRHLPKGRYFFLPWGDGANCVNVGK